MSELGQEVAQQPVPELQQQAEGQLEPVHAAQTHQHLLHLQLHPVADLQVALSFLKLDTPPTDTCGKVQFVYGIVQLTGK